MQKYRIYYTNLSYYNSNLSLLRFFVPVISNEFRIVSVSSSRLVAIPDNGSLP